MNLRLLDTLTKMWLIVLIVAFFAFRADQTGLASLLLALAIILFVESASIHIQDFINDWNGEE